MRDDSLARNLRAPGAGQGGCPMGCAPLMGSLRDMGALASPLSQADDRPDIGQRLPQILLNTTPDWRAACLELTAHIPSGYTYLAQLMGHDMGSSVPADSVPYARREGGVGPARRYNLIDNPLTLETVYGPGPAMLTHVYDPETCLFRLTRGARLARLYARAAGASSDPDPRPIRALYDERNRDSLMLHELTVAWMQFHNRLARHLMAEGQEPFRAYVLARAHALRCWHGILAGDLLPRFLHPKIAALDGDALPGCWALDETTLLHGLCRAFHALPLAAYHLGRSGLHNLGTLLKRGYAPSEAETDWHIDWPLFLGASPGAPLTGISASVAPELRAPVTAAAVIALDNRSAAEAGSLRPGNDPIRAAIAALPGDWPTRIAPARLADDFAAAHPQAPIRIDAEGLEWGPLYQFLMVEAQLHGRLGGFGPLGSALLRGSVLGSIRRVVLAPETEATAGLPRPATMLELITLARQ
ncbi:hypothetical protein LO749_19390 [Paracoccus denitrificans]|uniref:hypothetical protein n=1 Tax=Paracoccus denitrificans TaxID=266 RepID=UPI001E5A1E74|nr:hypothetical protein [Paracoccus denitrificans]UFS66669.1 hypothetical protein LO749_19390 [Paracoccus denitrificans]